MPQSPQILSQDTRELAGINSFSSEPQYREGFRRFTPGFCSAPYGDAQAVAVERAITANTAAVLVEPIQGEAGVVVPPEGFLRRLRSICTDANVLLIADEIQTGLGRTGKMFACEHERIVPDAYLLGKALSSAAGHLPRDPRAGRPNPAVVPRTRRKATAQWPNHTARRGDSTNRRCRSGRERMVPAVGLEPTT